MKKISLLLLTPLFPLLTFAQYSIQSKVVSSQTGELIEMATVRLLNTKDSTLVQGTQTDDKGEFTLLRIRDGGYTLLVSSVGYEAYSRDIEVKGRNVILRSINLKEDVKALSDVEVRGTAVQMVVRGDTIEYNAAAFKTAENAVVEELLKKMPGVEVSPEGKITVNGEEIKQIRVDGKKFFGDDAQMASKNIPAEMIEKVQVLDEKSEMAKLTGFEDDETERIINLTLKSSRKRGMFGNFTGAVGADMVNSNNEYFGYGDDFLENDARYNANVFLNLLLGESQTTIVAGANNTNEQRSGRGRANMSVGSGITRTENIGINTNMELSENLKFGGNGQGNHSNNLTTAESIKESYSNGQTFTDHNNSEAISNNWDARTRLEFEWKLNDKNTLIIQPEISYTNSYTRSSNNFLYLAEQDTTSVGKSYGRNVAETIDGSMRIIHNYKFDKPGRTLTTQAHVRFADTDGTKLSISEKGNIGAGTLEQINQESENGANSFRYSMRVSYVEPIYKNRHFLETSLALEGNNRNSTKEQYNIDANGHYTEFDSIYSNRFQNSFLSQTLELNYRIKDENYDLMFGGKVNPSQTYSYTQYGNQEERNSNNHVWNFSPTASFRYQFGKKEFARIEYRGRTSQPSIEQLEPSRNNSDIMSETVGNPGLNPAFNQSLRLFYSRYNTDRLSSISTGIMGSVTQNALVSNSIYDETGKQYRQTVNAKALPYSLSANFIYNTPIIQKRLHLNTGTSASYGERIGYTLKGVNASLIDIDNLALGDVSRTSNVRAEERLSLTFTHDVVELGAVGRIAYSRTNNNLSRQGATNVYDWSITGNATVRLPYQFTISSDIGYTARYGYRLSDVNELIWNAAIDKTLFKNQATVTLRAYDILNQRKNIIQVVGDNSVSYQKYNTLPTYFLLSFTYKLNKMGGLKGRTTGERPFEGGRPPMGERPIGAPDGPPPGAM